MKHSGLATGLVIATMSSGVSAAVISIPGMLDPQSVSFDSLAPTLLSYDEFDPSLGTLDSVEISFNGMVTIRSQTEVNLVNSGLLVFPEPYSAPVHLSMGFDSISRGFETTLDSIVPITVMANGMGDIATSIVPFSFSFSIDQDQDYGVPLLADPDGSGSATAMTINASLADFQPDDPLLTGLPIYTYFTANTLSFDPRINPFITTLSGSMQVNYWYTQEIEVTDVPLPAAAWLFGSGLLALVGVARRKKTN
jgi:hypothetical protein